MVTIPLPPRDARKLVLASSSPYRKALLSRLQLDFETTTPDIDETPQPHEDPVDTACRLALLKAQKVAEDYPHALIIGSDQTAVLNRQILGKPGTHEKAFEQLKACSGQQVVFYTALCLYNTETQQHQIQQVPTDIFFRPLTDEVIERYLELEKPYDCAGSAKIETLGITLIEAQRSTDPTAIIGLPLIALTDMLLAERYVLF